MKKFIKISALASALLFSSSVWAAEFGGLFSNESKFSGPDFGDMTLDQSDTLSAWVRVPFSKAGTSYFIAEGLFKFEQTPLLDDKADPENISAFDVDLFKVVSQKTIENGTLTFSAGRFATHDLSTMVFSQMADGALLTYDSTTVGFSAYAAYTGLLNGRTVSMITPDDKWFEKKDKLYQLAEKYAVAAVGVNFPNFAANQTFALQVMDAYRLEGDKFNRLYGEIQLNGPIASNFYYILNSVFNYNMLEIGGESDTAIANLSRIALSWYPGVYNMAFTLNGVYASGEQGPFESFCGFTSQTAVNLSDGNTEYSNLVKGGLTASIKPVANLLIAASGDAVFDAEKDIKYLGVFANFSVVYQVVSDVQAGLSSYLFKGDDSAFDKAAITASLAISF